MSNKTFNELLNELHGKGKLPAMKAHYAKKGEEASKSAENIAHGPNINKDPKFARQVHARFATSRYMKSQENRAKELMDRVGISEEDELEENLGTSLPIGKNRRGSKKTAFFKTSLGGSGQKQRTVHHRQGNQKLAGRYESYDLLAEARQKAFRKAKDIKDENKNPSGKTATGQTPDSINFEPMKQDFHQHIRDNTSNK